VVSDAERHGLERLHRVPSTLAGLSRARAVLLMAQGMAGIAIAERVAIRWSKSLHARQTHDYDATA
jgi:hypothetical protein